MGFWPPALATSSGRAWPKQTTNKQQRLPLRPSSAPETRGVTKPRGSQGGAAGPRVLCYRPPLVTQEETSCAGCTQAPPGGPDCVPRVPGRTLASTKPASGRVFRKPRGRSVGTSPPASRLPERSPWKGPAHTPQGGGLPSVNSGRGGVTERSKSTPPARELTRSHTDMTRDGHPNLERTDPRG